MAGPFTDRHPRPALTVDCVFLELDDHDLNVLLIQHVHRFDRRRYLQAVSTPSRMPNG